VRDLREGMDAAVGSARNDGRDSLLTEGKDGVFEGVLSTEHMRRHTRSMVLALPAVEGTAVIFEGEFPALHLLQGGAEGQRRAAQKFLQGHGCFAFQL